MSLALRQFDRILHRAHHASCRAATADPARITPPRRLAHSKPAPPPPATRSLSSTAKMAGDDDNDNVYKDPLKKLSDKDGQFRREASQFRSSISREPGAEFPPAKGRYVMYLNFGCPWAHRANIVRSLKGLEDVIELVVMSNKLGPNGWEFLPDGEMGSMPRDPLYGFGTLKELYLKADPQYRGRYTVPTLWDKEKETVVSNESADIIRMLFTEFDDFVPADRRESALRLLPDELRADIDALNEWVYGDINNGVYKAGFASTQEAYEENVTRLFAALDRVEAHLGDPKWKGPFLFGEGLTEADIRLFTTIVRFDLSYYTTFKCNLRSIRNDYPRIHDWVRRIYWGSKDGEWNGAFYSTTHFDYIKAAYGILKDGIIPIGPEQPILPRKF